MYMYNTSPDRQSELPQISGTVSKKVRSVLSCRYEDTFCHMTTDIVMIPSMEKKKGGGGGGGGGKSAGK